MLIGLCHQRFGPPHLARLKKLSEKYNCIGIEINSMDTDDAYEFCSGNGLEIVTLFNDDPLKYSFREVIKVFEEKLSPLKLDCIIIMGYTERTRLCLYYYCIRHHIKIITLSDSNSFDYNRNSIPSRIKHYIKKKIIKLPGFFIAAGKTSAEYLKQLGVSPELIIQGFDVVDNEYFMSMRQKITNSKSNNILFVGRLVERKNVIRLLKAYKIYNDKSEKKLKLVIAGFGKEEERIKKEIMQLGLDKVVIFAGRTNNRDIYNLYYNCAYLIVPSISEQWGLVINEAMACGLPVLASDRCGAAYSLIKEGVNGYMFSPFDIIDISNKMLRMDYDDHIKMGQESLNIIRDWGLEKFISNVEYAIKHYNQKKYNYLDLVCLRMVISFSKVRKDYE